MAEVSKTDILKHLDSIDLNELLDRMEAYTRLRFYSKSERDRDGVDYLDFCYNVLIKACDGVRKWNKESAYFEEFIFGCLKSDLYNFFRKQRDKLSSSEKEEGENQESYLIELNDYIDLNEIEDEEDHPDLDFEEVKKHTLKSLKSQGSDKLEIEVFECWLVGYYKPKEIAELCGSNTTSVNNAIKRLSRKTIKLQEEWISLKK